MNADRSNDPRERARLAAVLAGAPRAEQIVADLVRANPDWSALARSLPPGEALEQRAQALVEGAWQRDALDQRFFAAALRSGQFSPGFSQPLRDIALQWGVSLPEPPAQAYQRLYLSVAVVAVCGAGVAWLLLRALTSSTPVLPLLLVLGAVAAAAVLAVVRSTREIEQRYTLAAPSAPEGAPPADLLALSERFFAAQRPPASGTTVHAHSTPPTPADAHRLGRALAGGERGWFVYSGPLGPQTAQVLDALRVAGHPIAPLSSEVMQAALADGRCQAVRDELERAYFQDQGR